MRVRRGCAIGGSASRRAAVGESRRILGLYEERYGGFTLKHFHEQLVKRHNYKLGYTVTRLSLHGAGLVKPAPKRSAHRKKRPPRPMVGMMLHQDASRFAWLPEDERQYDLVGYPGRRDERGLPGLPGRRGWHGVELSRSGRVDRHTRAVLRALHRPRQPLLSYAQSRRAGFENAAHPNRTGVGAARHPPNRGLFARGARPLRARLPHPAGPPAEGAGPGRHRDDRGGQPVYRPSATCRSTTPPSRSRPNRLAAPSCPVAPAKPVRSCVSRRSVVSATTTPSNGAPSPCSFRRARFGRTSCAPRSGCMNTQTHAWPSSTAPIAWRTTILRESSAMTPNWLPQPLRQRPDGFVDNAVRCPQPHTPNYHHGSGQLTPYKGRPT